MRSIPNAQYDWALEGQHSPTYKSTSTTGTHNTPFTVLSTSTDGVAVYAVYALIMTQSGQVVENVSMAHQNKNNYSAIFTIPAQHQQTTMWQRYTQSILGENRCCNVEQLHANRIT